MTELMIGIPLLSGFAFVLRIYLMQLANKPQNKPGPQPVQRNLEYPFPPIAKIILNGGPLSVPAPFARAASSNSMISWHETKDAVKRALDHLDLQQDVATVVGALMVSRILCQRELIPISCVEAEKSIVHLTERFPTIGLHMNTISTTMPDAFAALSRIKSTASNLCGGGVTDARVLLTVYELKVLPIIHQKEPQP